MKVKKKNKTTAKRWGRGKWKRKERLMTEEEIIIIYYDSRRKKTVIVSSRKVSYIFNQWEDDKSLWRKEKIMGPKRHSR